MKDGGEGVDQLIPGDLSLADSAFAAIGQEHDERVVKDSDDLRLNRRHRFSGSHCHRACARQSPYRLSQCCVINEVLDGWPQ
jgi:hypothetical protein